jgi:hypothetical protein
MTRIAALPLLIFLLTFGQVRLYAFENSQHRNITTYAISKISARDYPDIARFGPSIIGWSWGIGAPSQQNGFFATAAATVFNVGNPAEELAHLEDQTQPMDYTSGIDGGDFSDFLNIKNGVLTGKIANAYQSSSFTNTEPVNEGAYVWAGAAVHLIEDQASPPHAANILHGLGDEFEGPESFLGGKTSNLQSFNQTVGADQPVSEYFFQCLQQTQSVLSVFTANVNGTTYQTWLPNNYPILVSQFGKSSTNYDGKPIGNPPIPVPSPAVRLQRLWELSPPEFLCESGVRAILYA